MGEVKGLKPGVQHGSCGVLARGKTGFQGSGCSVEEASFSLNRVQPDFQPGRTAFSCSGEGTGSLYYVGADGVERYVETEMSFRTASVSLEEPLAPEDRIEVHGSVEWVSFRQSEAAGEIMAMVSCHWSLVKGSTAPGRSLSFTVPVSLESTTFCRPRMMGVTGRVLDWQGAPLQDGLKITGRLKMCLYYATGKGRLFVREAVVPLYHWLGGNQGQGLTPGGEDWQMEVSGVNVTGTREEGGPGRRKLLVKGEAVMDFHEATWPGQGSGKQPR